MLTTDYGAAPELISPEMAKKSVFADSGSVKFFFLFLFSREINKMEKHTFVVASIKCGYSEFRNSHNGIRMIYIRLEHVTSMPLKLKFQIIWAAQVAVHFLNSLSKTCTTAEARRLTENTRTYTFIELNAPTIPYIFNELN